MFKKNTIKFIAYIKIFGNINHILLVKNTTRRNLDCFTEEKIKE